MTAYQENRHGRVMLRAVQPIEDYRIGARIEWLQAHADERQAHRRAIEDGTWYLIALGVAEHGYNAVIRHIVSPLQTRDYLAQIEMAPVEPAGLAG